MVVQNCEKSPPSDANENCNLFLCKMSPWEDYFITKWTLAVLCKYKLATQGKGCFLLALPSLYSHSAHSSVLVRKRAFHKHEQLIVYEYSRYSHYQGLWFCLEPRFQANIKQEYRKKCSPVGKREGMSLLALTVQFTVTFLEADYKGQ